MTKNDFIERARNVHGYKYKYIGIPDNIRLVDYIKMLLDGEEYTQRVNKHLIGRCPEKSTKRKTIDDFINESILIWGDRFDYSLTDYRSVNDKILLIDNKTGIVIEQLPGVHLNGHEPKGINGDDFIVLSKLVFNRYSYDKCVYVNKTVKVIITCPDHGDFLIKPFDHLNYGYGCKKCPEYNIKKNVSKFLNKYNITFYREHRFIGCKLPFDFYIPSLRCVIEISSDPVNDKVRNNYCEENFIDIISFSKNNKNIIWELLWDNLKDRIKRYALPRH